MAARFGRYLLGPRLAAGGMGEVYLGFHLGLGGFAKPIVLKLLLPHLTDDPESVRLFLHEARLAAGMSHPNVVQIFDVAHEQGRYFIAMELVQGVSLSTLLRACARADREPPASVIEHVARSLCEALHYAHELEGLDGKPLEIVHRDVTPQNVLVSTSGQVKLTDFGIAKARDSGIRTETGTIRGKFQYLSPEQVLGQPVDRRADVFSAGLTLFHFAALESPLQRETDAATLKAVMTEPVPSLRAFRPDLPERLVAAVDRATAREPPRRFTTALEMRDALLPPGPEDGAAALGRLVAELCGSALEELDKKIELTSSMRTERVASGRRRALLIGGPAALLGAGLAASVLFGWPKGPPPPKEEPPPASAAPAPPPEDIPPRPAEGASRTREKPAPKPRAERVGYLTVDAVPWAKVKVNGVRIGDTPIDGYPVRAGTAVVELTHPESKRSVSRRVSVRAGEKAFLKVDLR